MKSENKNSKIDTLANQKAPTKEALLKALEEAHKLADILDEDRIAYKLVSAIMILKEK